MEFYIGVELLELDYSKSTLEVYRESVEVETPNSQNTDVLIYFTGD